MAEGIITRRRTGNKYSELVSASGSFYKAPNDEDDIILVNDLTFKPVWVGLYYTVSAGFDFGAAWWYYEADITEISFGNNDISGIQQEVVRNETTNQTTYTATAQISDNITLLKNGFNASVILSALIGGEYAQGTSGNWFAMGYEV